MYLLTGDYEEEDPEQTLPVLEQPLIGPVYRELPAYTRPDHQDRHIELEPIADVDTHCEHQLHHDVQPGTE